MHGALFAFVALSILFDAGIQVRWSVTLTFEATILGEKRNRCFAFPFAILASPSEAFSFCILGFIGQDTFVAITLAFYL